jgi:predicted ribosomally synthesized peptide with nif11-like leader
MSKGQLDAFLEKVKEDPSLQKKFKTLYLDTLSSFASEAGFDINLPDLASFLSLSDKEIENDIELFAPCTQTQYTATLY